MSRKRLHVDIVIVNLRRLEEGVDLAAPAAALVADLRATRLAGSEGLKKGPLGNPSRNLPRIPSI